MRHVMGKTFRNSWALFAGIGLIMVGNGLQTTLLGVRATLETFDPAAIGIIMSTFYVGFLAGSSMTPVVVKRVGHIRVFAAWASLASAAVLVHGVVIDPWVWIVARAVTGFAYAGMYVVAESWLNDQSDNESRGRVLSIYMVVQYLGLAVGQLMLNLDDPATTVLFVVASITVSLALVPISLSASPAPIHGLQQRVGLRELWRLTPLGLATCVIAGTTTGVLLGMGAVFTSGAGYSLEETSLFMAALIIGGVVFQVPLGRMSDRVSRRGVIIGVALLAAAVAAASLYLEARDVVAVGLAFVLGGLSLPLYALGISHANDDLVPEQMVAASSALVVAFGVGAAAGPVIVSTLLESQPYLGFFGLQAGLYLALGLYGIYRITRREGAEHRESYQPLPISVSVAPEVYRLEGEPTSRPARDES